MTGRTAERTFHTGRRLAAAAIYGAGFAIVWGIAHQLSDLAPQRLPLYLNWETDIPFQPWALPVYFSLDVLVAIIPFLCVTWQRSATLMGTLLIQLLIAAPFFVLVPIEPGYTNEMATGVWGTWLFEPLGMDNLSRWNHTPSLHVAYACTIALYWRRGPAWARWTWAIAVCISTMLVHEHHLICIAGGLLLFVLTGWWVPRWLKRFFPAPTAT
ncbi:MAG: phosphatase PAP2 family protein [Phycisphaerales bacterium]|nr:phosphatase PAP2 family protein [Phycisphaerales bacterium]